MNHSGIQNDRFRTPNGLPPPFKTNAVAIDLASPGNQAGNQAGKPLITKTALPLEPQHCSQKWYIPRPAASAADPEKNPTSSIRKYILMIWGSCGGVGGLFDVDDDGYGDVDAGVDVDIDVDVAVDVDVDVDPDVDVDVDGDGDGEFFTEPRSLQYF